MKREIPILITMIVGLFMVFKLFISSPLIQGIITEVEQWGLIIISFAFLLGMLNILQLNLQAISNRQKEWGYNAVLVISMLAVVGLGLYERWYYGKLGKETLFYQFVFEYVLLPLSATMFALLAFFIASAAFRAFRARTFEATLLLLAGTLVMIGRVPLGSYIWTGFPEIATFIMETFNKAGMRGIIIGAAMGIIATSLRIILGIERPYLKGE